MIPRMWAKRQLEIMDKCFSSDQHALSDVFFVPLTNQARAASLVCLVIDMYRYTSLYPTNKARQQVCLCARARARARLKEITCACVL